MLVCTDLMEMGGVSTLYSTLPLVQCAYTNVKSSPTVLPSEKISASMYRTNGDGGSTLYSTLPLVQCAYTNV